MAITLVQNKGAEFTSVSSGAITLTSSVTAGNLLIARYTEINSNNRTPSISDNLGNTWNSLTLFSANSRKVQIFYCLSALAGSTTVTLTSSGSDGFDFGVEEYSGPGAWSYAQNDTEGSSGNVTSHICGATGLTTSATSSLVIGTSVLTGATGGITPGSGYTSITAPTTTGGTVWLYQVTTGSISTQAPFTSVFSHSDCGEMAEFRSASGGNTYNETASGGAYGSGEAVIWVDYFPSVSGGISDGGSGTVQGTYNPASTGAALAGGSGTVYEIINSISVSGGVLVSGSAPYGNTISYTGSGSGLLGSAAIVFADFFPQSSGSGIVGGAANLPSSNTYNQIGSGGCICTGQAPNKYCVLIYLGTVNISHYSGSIRLASYTGIIRA